MIPSTPTARPSHRPARRGGLRVAASGAAACLVWATTVAHAANISTPVPVAEASPVSPLPARVPGSEHTAGWWMAFDDATLNLLVHAAQQREAGFATLRPSALPDEAPAAPSADQVRRQVVGSYVGARVLSVRWLALNGLREAADRQVQLLQGSPLAPADKPQAQAVNAEREATLASLKQRSERVKAQLQALAQQRQDLLETLAALCGQPADELSERLSPVLTQTSLPAFGSAVPPRLPLNIVRARPDVAAAEAAVLRSLRSSGSPAHQLLARMQQPEGWIEPDAVIAGSSPQARPAAQRVDEAETPALDEWRQRVDEAAREVAQDLRSLSDSARLEAERAQLAEASRQVFYRAREQLKAGQGNEFQVLEHYQQLLAESDRHAAATGELAMAWVRLVASTGASEQVLRR